MIENEDLRFSLSFKALSLRFKGQSASLEKEFRKEYLDRSAKNTRFSLILGLFFYSVFGILDAMIIPEQKYSLWLIRYVIVDPVLIILIILSLFRSLRKYLEAFGVIGLLVAGTGISVMVAIAAPPANYSYYAGVILVLMLGYGLVRIRFIWASIAGWLNVLIYEFISIFIVETPSEILINNNFFFISANLIGMISCYVVEYYIRRNFIMARQLEVEKENVNNLNVNLENMVNIRTAELISVNEELQAEINVNFIAERERQSLEQKLFQAQKMESLGKFAGGIAHDFNNILSSILGFTEISLGLVQDDTVLKNNLNVIYSSGERAAELVGQILSFARKSEKKMEPLRPDLILNEALKFIRSSIPTTIEIKKSITSNSLVMGNAIQIYQIFMNIFINSAHAMNKEGGILEIKMSDIEVKPDDSQNQIPGIGNYIQIEICDTGEGIPPDIIDSVFEPYFTTKKTGEGTGLGLAVVHGIIESYGGYIRLDSIQGEGSSIIIHLPITEEEIQVLDNDNIIAPRGNERILLVDDESAIVAFEEIILSSLGYKVTGVISSIEALNIFKKNPEKFDLIITDMTMPQMSGDQLAQEINKVRDDIPVIICSGYRKDISENKKNRSIRSYVNKPFTKSEMATEIRIVLDL